MSKNTEIKFVGQPIFKQIVNLVDTVITTNRSFHRWSEIFGDPVLTAAMVDRITHKAHIINMKGMSYRVKETNGQPDFSPD